MRIEDNGTICVCSWFGSRFREVCSPFRPYIRRWPCPICSRDWAGGATSYKRGSYPILAGCTRTKCLNAIWADVAQKIKLHPSATRLPLDQTNLSIHPISLGSWFCALAFRQVCPFGVQDYSSRLGLSSQDNIGPKNLAIVLGTEGRGFLIGEFKWDADERGRALKKITKKLFAITSHW